MALQVVQKQSQIYSRRAFHSIQNLDNSETGGKHIGNILLNFEMQSIHNKRSEIPEENRDMLYLVIVIGTPSHRSSIVEPN